MEGYRRTREIAAPERLVPLSVPALGGSPRARDIVYVDVGYRDLAPLSERRVAGSQQARKLVEVPLLPVEIQMGVPVRVLHHVREHVQPMRSRLFLEFDPDVLQRLDKVGVGDGLLRPGRFRNQCVDARLQCVAHATEPGRRATDVGRHLRGQVIAVAKAPPALVFCLRHLHLTGVEGFAESSQKGERRVGGTGQQIGADFRVALESQREVAQQPARQRGRDVVEGLGEVEQEDDIAAGPVPVDGAKVSVTGNVARARSIGSEHPTHADQGRHGQQRRQYEADPARHSVLASRRLRSRAVAVDVQLPNR